MSHVTIISEPLVEKFGRGFSKADERPETAVSGDGINLAAAIHRILPRLNEYGTGSEQHEISVLAGLGDDEDGKAIKQFMAEEGLSTRHVVEVPGRKTSSYTIHREEGGNKRSVEYNDRGPDSAMAQFLEAGPQQHDADAAIADVKENTDTLIITGIGASRARSEEAFEKLIDMATAVRERGGRVIVDFNHRINAETGEAKLWVDDNNNPLSNDVVRERMDRLYALSNVAFVAHDEMWPVYSDVFQPPLTKGQEPTDGEAIAKHLMELPTPEGIDGKRDVFFKRGKEGGTLYHEEDNGNIKTSYTVGNRVTTKDRNGGGDNLIGGTVAGLLSGYSLEDSLNIGQRLAGQVVQHLGGVIRHDHLLTDEQLDAALGKSERNFGLFQDQVTAGLQSAPFVPVFQLTTHNGQNTILEDAERKVEAMHKGGIKQFEFLLRGDETMELDPYIDQTLKAIDTLAEKYTDAKFGVGTVSSAERMQKVVENPNVSFIVTAHWPGEDMIKAAVRNGKPIIPTVSHSDTVSFKEEGRIVAPGKKGTDELDPERIRNLRDMGVDTIKVFNFGAIAQKRLGDAQKTDAPFIAAGLTAIAEGIRDSYNGQEIPKDKKFFAMTTGGVTEDNLPYLVAGAKNPKVKEEISKLAGGPVNAKPLLDILEQTTAVGGGTFITKKYDANVGDDQDAASKALEVLSSDVTRTVEQGKQGIIATRRPGS